MERITSCESTLSELVLFSSDFNIGDRVRRIAGAGVATATCSADTAGTIRYVGPIAPRLPPPSQSNKPNTTVNQIGSSPSEPSSPVDPLSASNGSPTTNLPPSASSASLTNNNNNSGPIYIGVEWDMPVGKNDGSVDGVRYFSCDAGYGSFVLPKVLSKGLPLATLLEARYGSSTVRQEAGTITTASAERNTQTRPLQLGPAIGYRDPETGAFVKVVNCDCTANEQLGLAATAGGDKLGLLFPNLRDLSVAATLLASWDEVKLIGASLPNLATFDLSRNPALGAPTANHKNFVGLCDSSNETIVISPSVQELRICDMKAMTPDCIEFLLSGFPNLKSLFAARNNLTLKGHSKKGLTKRNSTKNSSNNNDSPCGTSTKNVLENSSSSSSSPSTRIAGLLTYLNIEGNEGIDCLEDVADLIGLERCQSLTALNVSSTSISDAPHLPPIEPDTVLAAFANKASTNNNNNPDSNSNSAVLLLSSSGGSTSPSSSNSPSKQNAVTSPSLFPEIPPPLFPNLTSLYMSKTPVRSWLALSRLMHRAANCVSSLQDVHFSTTASDSVDQEQHDDGLSTAADEAVDADDDDDSESESASTVSVAGCFLPEDFRDRRRLSVAFMPPNVKKFNRSEITSVERSSAITRSVPQFLQLVKRIIIKNADDPEEAEEIEMICPKRLGDLPRHLHRQIVNEHQRGKTVSQNHGVGYIYRPASLGPRKVLNEFEVNIRCVFVSTKDQCSNYRGEYFRCVLAKIKEEEEEERLTALSHASPPQEEGEEQEGQGEIIKEKPSALPQQNYSEKDLKKRNNAFGKVKLMIDVRWETRQLEAAVRDALGMNSPSASMNGDPTKAPSNGATNGNKVTPINLFHIDKELMENPGAVAQGLHCKYLSRPWEKLHTSKVAENDDIIACIGP